MVLFLILYKPQAYSESPISFIIRYGCEWEYVNSLEWQKIFYYAERSLRRPPHPALEEAKADYVNPSKWSKNGVVDSVHCYRSSSRFASDHNSFSTPRLIYYLPRILSLSFSRDADWLAIKVALKFVARFAGASCFAPFLPCGISCLGCAIQFNRNIVELTGVKQDRLRQVLRPSFRPRAYLRTRLS